MVAQTNNRPGPPPSAATLVDLLRWRAAVQHDDLAYAFIEDGEAGEAEVTYGELDRRARALGAWLQSRGMAGEKALLLFPPGLDYIATFFGCLYAGVVAIPAYPPRLNRPVPRIQAIVSDAHTPLALTTYPILANIERRFEQAPDLAVLNWLDIDNVPPSIEEDWQQPDIDGNTLAFLQYTSGSTSIPKGVMLSHGNLMANLEMIYHGFQMDPYERGCFWLPSYHDMGLIGGILEPMYLSGSSLLMSPASFLQRPARWLESITRFRATVTGAPNFAYDLCVDKITPEQRESLDLSSLKVVFCGAEPIRPETLPRFAEAFAPHGLRPDVFYPCYGLAEGTLLVAGGQGPGVPHVHTVKTSELTRHRAVATDPDDDAQPMVSCGGPLLDEQIAIVDPDTLERCAPDRVGEIWVAGRNVACGYWNQTEETERTFKATIAETDEGPFLRTGDLGFMHDGQLYVTGRLKDLLIIRGRNHYPQDIELTAASSHEALERDAGAVFTLDEGGEEQLVIVHEVARQHRAPDIEAVALAVRRAVAEHHDLQIHALVLIKPLKIPRTSSGKIKRHACKEQYLDGSLPIVAEWRADQTPAGELAPTAPAADVAPAAQPTQSAAAIQAWLVKQIARRANISPAAIDVRRPFIDFGLDSVQAVGLAGDLEVWLDRPLVPTLVWDYPNIEMLAAYLAGERPEAQAQPAPAPQPGYASEPIAVVGLGLRFPGAESPHAFWRLLRDGVDAIREVPRDRWDVEDFYDTDPATPGRMNTRWGGFLEQVDQFDAPFFGIAPREVTRMDPQQRLLLEVAWEALEHAGQAPHKLAGTQTGVFVGISSHDYSYLQMGDVDQVDAYVGTGNAHSIAANRLSYVLDLHGPSVAVDTACSSSLVAVHLACQSLRLGESDLALVGGVNLLLSPELTVSFSQGRFMSSDGHCKAFDAQADGYVRSEGCGMVVLKRFSDALRDGDNILALVRGTAVNQDGRTNGLTAPNGSAQQAVIRQALHNAGVAPGQIDYVEAHGTGTPLGDPIEIQALRAVIEDGRAPDQPYLVGSVKTNLGHLEAAAGIAGLIKVVLALANEEIPPHLHLKEVSPYIPLDGSPLVFPTERHAWPRRDTPRLAGVSSFGFGGTNAHVVLSEAPPASPPPEEQDERPLHLLVLSARSESALRTLAVRYAERLADDPARLADICYTASTGRTHFEHRLAVVGESAEEMRGLLEAFAAGEQRAGLIAGRVEYRERPRIAFLFTGAGPQHPGMGRTLYETEPAFRATLDRFDEMLRPRLERPLLEVMHPQEGDDDSLLHELAYTQPALFALEVALAELWRSWGIEPDAVMGHSTGEYAAACVAGVFNPEDGLSFITERAQLMQALPQEGMMAAIYADQARVTTAIIPYVGRASLAAVNGPQNIVVSGEREAVQALIDDMAAQGSAARLLVVSNAAHSPLMEPMLDDLEALARRIPHQPLQIPLISNVTGQPLAPGFTPDPDYWRQHARGTVQFLAGMTALADADIFLELGPTPTLLAMGRQCLPDSRAAWLASLRAGKNDWRVLLGTLGTLYVQGVEIDWEGFAQGAPRRRVPLPTYPFERQRYWLDLPAVGRPARDAFPLITQNGWQVGLRRFEERLAALPAGAELGLILGAAVEAFGAELAAGQPEEVVPEEVVPEEVMPEEPSEPQPDLREALLAEEPAARLPLCEAYLQAQVARVLGLDPARLDPQQRLDALGLDSLMAMELKNRLEADLGISLPVVDFLQGPTVIDLAGRALDDLSQPRAQPATALVPAPDPDGLHPLSYGQQALWFLHQLMPEDLSFNVAGAVRLLGDLDPAALQRAFEQLLERHPALRTRYSVIDGQPVQAIREPVDAFQVLDGSDWSEADLHTYLVQEAHRPFELEHGPLLRASLIRRADKEHVLLLAIDHIATDFWSMSIIAFEWLLLYEALHAGVPPTLPPIESLFIDYVHWQNAILDGPEGERQWEYWRDQLGGELPLLDLPTDRPRAPLQTYRGDVETLVLPAGLAEQLDALARSHGATIFTVLLAAFQALLHRYTGQEDLLVGSVMAGRSHSALNGVVGYFISPVALRADLSGGPAFSDFLAQVRQTVFEAFEHQDYPLALLAQRLKIARDASRPPLFETMFIYQKAQLLDEKGLSAFALGIPGLRLEASGLTLESMALGGHPAQFDLTMMMAATEGGLAASMQYNTALFDASTIRQLLAHFSTLLEGIAADPGLPIPAIPLLTGEEQDRLLTGWNATQADYPPDVCVHQLFEAQAARTPDAVAATCEDEQVTYGELNRRANRLAHALQGLGVGPGALAAICVERSIDMLVALLGVLKAGGAYVPLDPAYPEDRLAFMLADSQAAVLLTQAALLGALPEHDARVVLLDADGEDESALSEENPASDVTHDDLAYVIYTSGSTGQPKGVEVLHRGVANFLHSMAREPGLTADDKLLAVTTLSFDIAVLELFLPLITGAQVEIVPREVAADGVLLAEKLAESGTTVMQATPATWRLLLEAGWPGASGLRILCGGEALPRDLAGKLLTRCAALWNLYGPTETTVWSTVQRVEAGSGSVPVGRPVANTQVYLLDANMAPVPVGVAGELYIGGDGVARGYHNRPELTAVRFVPDPFSAQPGARLYRTGDLARYLPDGSIEFLGRHDHQVKLRGFRIELGEIEAALGEHPAIEQAVVIAREDTPGDRRLAAYLVLHADQPEPAAADLRAFLRQTLPEYMLPAAYVPLDALPLTPNGKVNRRALPAPPQSTPGLEATYVAPRTPLEEELAALCAGVLGLERVGVEHSFFDLGGNSLLATRLIFQVRERYQTPLPLRALFEDPTVAGLARAIENGQMGRVASVTLDDLIAEAALDPAITGAGLPNVQPGAPEHALLTGATGFVGAFLLRDLLAETGATVHCLVRAESVEEGRQRVRRNLEAYDLWDEAFDERIVMVPGDLSAPLLGLPAESFEALAERIDTIYHNGAMVNIIHAYQAHKPANVLGTQEVLRLAATARLKPVHFVSTLSVFHTGGHLNGVVFREDASLVENGAPYGGYAQSKWVAERLVMAAMERGIPAAIYRPGLISGASETGAWNTEDIMSTLTRVCLAVGAVPDLDVMVDVVPVDYVSRAIVRLSQQPGSSGNVFHLANPHPLHYSALIESLRAHHFQVRSLPFGEWRGELFSQAASNGWNPFLPLIEEVNEDQVFMPSCDCTNTLAGLAGSDVICPPVGPALLDTYLSYYERSGFLAGISRA